MKWKLRAFAAAFVSLCVVNAPASAGADGDPMFVTGYTCQPYCGATASGEPVGPGAAACPPDVDFGTQLMIEDVGIVTCLDRYAPSLSRRVDVWMPTVEACYAITGWHNVSLL
jgi:3D (Asp-Asp-Asp) domain-containing protein